MRATTPSVQLENTSPNGYLLRPSAPQFTRGDPHLVEPCDNTALWDAWVNVTISQDTTYCTTGKTNFYSIKATANGGDAQDTFRPRITWGAPINVDGKMLLVRFYVHEGTGDSSYEYIDNILLILGDGATTDTYYLYEASEAFQAYPGWHEACIMTSEGVNSDTPTVDYTAVTNAVFQCMMTDTANRTPAITIDEMTWIDRPAKAKIAFCFDGAYTDQEAAAAYLKSQGMIGTFFFCETLLGTAGRLSLAQIHRMADAGHLMGNYPYNLGVYWQDMTQAQKTQAIQLQANWMYDNGLGEGARLISTPGGSWSQEDRDLAGRYFDAACTMAVQPYHNHDPRFLARSLWTDNSRACWRERTFAQALAGVITEGASVVYFRHMDDVTPETDFTRFKAHVGDAGTAGTIAKAVADGDAEIVTPLDLLGGA
ncbi:MAG TPA: polysaccharide deacetylase family protein [Phycisphaerae bacterium]|nr:polysaccharide deacetylase family protein [Phycisphaerae bacterium]